MKGIIPKEPLLTEIYLTVNGMTCSACATSIRNVIGNCLGPKTSIDVNILTGRVFIKTSKPVNQPQEIAKCIEDAGFTCILDNTKINRGEPNISELRLWFRRLVVCCIFGIPEFILCMVVMNFSLIPKLHHSFHSSIRSSSILEFFLVTPLQWSIGLLYAKKALRNLRLGVCTMDLLVSIASFACYWISIVDMFFIQNDEWIYFEASSTLLLFVTIGKFLECYAKEKTKTQVNNLCQGIEKCIIATLCLGNGEEKKSSVALLKIGDILIVKGGEYFPADGVIIKGETTADESLITGESHPITKTLGCRVFAGSVNGNGIVKMKVEQEYSNSTISQVIQLVQSSSQKKPKVQNIADEIASVFVPSSFNLFGNYICDMDFIGIFGVITVLFIGIWIRNICPNSRLPLCAWTSYPDCNSRRKRGCC